MEWRNLLTVILCGDENPCMRMKAKLLDW